MSICRASTLAITWNYDAIFHSVNLTSHSFPLLPMVRLHIPSTASTLVLWHLIWPPNVTVHTNSMFIVFNQCYFTATLCG